MARRRSRTAAARPIAGAGTVARAWMPWVLLSVCVTMWGLPPVKARPQRRAVGRGEAAPAHVAGTLARAARPKCPLLHRRVFRDFPVVPEPVDPRRLAEPAYRDSARRGGGVHAQLALGHRHGDSLRRARDGALPAHPASDGARGRGRATSRAMRRPLLTIALMLALGFVTRYGGTDATLGLAFTRTGWLYPFFAAMLGWLGVALTGSDTSSNVLFGSLQKITAQQLGLNPMLIVTANSTGGVMGKMIDAQSIVVADGRHAPGGPGRRPAPVRLLAQPRAGRHHGPHHPAQAYLLPWMVPGN